MGQGIGGFPVLGFLFACPTRGVSGERRRYSRKGRVSPVANTLHNSGPAT